MPVFSLYERTAHNSSLGTGLVWSLTAFTADAFYQNWPDADGSEVLGASSYLIGSDDDYMYLLSTPTDVQFLEDDLYSYVAYETLKAQSQQVLEDFLVRNDIAPNPLCPDADGCYRYTGLRGDHSGESAGGDGLGASGGTAHGKRHPFGAAVGLHAGQPGGEHGGCPGLSDRGTQDPGAGEQRQHLYLLPERLALHLHPAGRPV